MRLVDADQLCQVMDHIGEHCYETGREDIAGVIFAVTDVVRRQPTIDTAQIKSYRVPAKAEWMERYCTKKQLAGYEARKEKSDG